MSFRSILRFLVPSWLNDNITGSHADILDESIARARAGLEARFPSRAQPDALALIGKDRGIPRGRSETDQHYANRLIAWRYPRGHRVRGSAFALLNQIFEYFGGLDCWTIDVKGNKHERSATGEESFSYGNAWVWDTDPRLWRFWVVIVPGSLMRAQPNLGDPTLWGGALGTPGYSIGQLGATPGDADAMRDLFTGDCPWKPDNAIPMWLIVNLDGTTQAPDPTWTHWSKNVAGVQVPSRYAGWRYWALSAGVNDYSGTAGNWPTSTTVAGGTTYAPSAGSWPTSITLPDGSTYSPTPGAWRSKVTLVDDGGVPV